MPVDVAAFEVHGLTVSSHYGRIRKEECAKTQHEANSNVNTKEFSNN